MDSRDLVTLFGKQVGVLDREPMLGEAHRAVEDQRLALVNLYGLVSIDVRPFVDTFAGQFYIADGETLAYVLNHTQQFIPGTLPEQGNAFFTQKPSIVATALEAMIQKYAAEETTLSPEDVQRLTERHRSVEAGLERYSRGEAEAPSQPPEISHHVDLVNSHPYIYAVHRALSDRDIRALVVDYRELTKIVEWLKNPASAPPFARSGAFYLNPRNAYKRFSTVALDDTRSIYCAKRGFLEPTREGTVDTLYVLSTKPLNNQTR